MKAALLFQPIASREPLAYCLLAARRFWFWRRYAEREMRYTVELGTRQEAEFWESQAEALVRQGHVVEAPRAHALGLLPVGDLETFRGAVGALRVAASAEADARVASAAPQARPLTLSSIQTSSHASAVAVPAVGVRSVQMGLAL